MIESFMKGHNHARNTDSKWEVISNSLYFGDVLVASYNTETKKITKVDLETLTKDLTGSTRAAVIRGSNMIEVFNVVDVDGIILVESLAWIDALKAKKSLNNLKLSLVKIEQ